MCRYLLIDKKDTCYLFWSGYSDSYFLYIIVVDTSYLILVKLFSGNYSLVFYEISTSSYPQAYHRDSHVSRIKYPSLLTQN